MKIKIPVASEKVQNSNTLQVCVTVGERKYWLRVSDQSSFLVLLDILEEIKEMVERESLKDIRDFLQGMLSDVERKIED